MIFPEEIRKHFMPVSFNKGDFILSFGEIEQYLHYIEKGIVRYFYYDAKKDKEITTDFTFSKQYCLSYASFAKQIPSLIEIQALTDVKAYRIKYKVIEELITDNLDFLRTKNHILEELFVEKCERELRFLTQTPEENYLYLLEKEPVMMQNIPLKYLASYIGITPQALSRIRKRIVL